MPGPFDQGWRRIVIAASGPSFTVEQADMIERARADGICRVIAVNATGLPPDPPKRPVGLPNADALYGADGSFWTGYGARIKASFLGQLWTRDKASADRLGLRFIRAEKRDGLTKDLGAVNTGGNSGYTAVNLAYLFGAIEIVLVGFDMQRGPDDRAHHHGNHDDYLNERGQTCVLANPSDAALKRWCGDFNALARDLERSGIVVINSTTSTAINCFPTMPLGEALARWSADRSRKASLDRPASSQTVRDATSAHTGTLGP